MPSISAVGDRSPVSTTMIRPSSSTTVMFLPISPRPPSGSTRRLMAPPERLPRSSCGGQEAVALQRPAARRRLLLLGLAQRPAKAADLVAEQVERRLDQDRVGHGEQRVEEV